MWLHQAILVVIDLGDNSQPRTLREQPLRCSDNCAFNALWVHFDANGYAIEPDATNESILSMRTDTSECGWRATMDSRRWISKISSSPRPLLT